MRAEVDRLHAERGRDSYTIARLLGYIVDVGEYLRDHVSDDIARDLPEMPQIDNRYWRYLE